MKGQIVLVYYASRDREMPRRLRILALATAAYALSPIDLIPDFIPVLGLLDDLVLVPLSIALIIRYTPAAVLQRARQLSAGSHHIPSSRVAVFIVILLWLVCAALALVLLYRAVS
jgi:uncharacterized membrane protein YkvA (DUF1232 family)